MEDGDTPIGLHETLAVLAGDLIDLGKVLVRQLVVLEVGLNALL
jgi:hypothetical protein